jgi:hypothetical protein
MFGFFAMPYQCFAKPLSSHSQEHSNQARKFVVSRICHGRRSFCFKQDLPWLGTWALFLALSGPEAKNHIIIYKCSEFM